MAIRGGETIMKNMSEDLKFTLRCIIHAETRLKDQLKARETAKRVYDKKIRKIENDEKYYIEQIKTLKLKLKEEDK